MSQEVLFSAPGIELVIFRNESEFSAAITLSKDDVSITQKIEGKELNKFYGATRFLIRRNFVQRNKSEASKEKAKESNKSTYYNEAINFIRTFLIRKITSSEFNQSVFDWLDSDNREDYTFSFKKSDITNDEREEAEVFIGIPQEEVDIFTIERIQNATGDFMEAMGFELETQDEPVYGSFFQKLKYLLRGEVKQEASELYAKGKTALEAQFIDLPSAEVTDKLASAAASLITSLNGVNDAAIRCGSLLIVKVTKDGVPRIVTETISLELAALLNKNPALLQNPSIVFDLISGMRAPDRTIEESGSAELAE